MENKTLDNKLKILYTERVVINKKRTSAASRVNSFLGFPQMQKTMKGINWSKDNIYDGIGRPDLKPNKYESLNRLDKELNALIIEIADLHRELIMDGTPDELQVEQYVEGIEYVLGDAVGYQLSKIRNLMK